MPSRWETSTRPLFVRTIWVNGLRHAILSTDDPLLQYKYRSTPSSLTSSETSSVMSGSYRLEECLVKLRLALNPTEKEESVHSNCYQYEKLPILPKFYSTETPELPRLPEEENQLSERVLQWLDLSGRLPEPEIKPDRRKPEKTYTTRRKEFPTRSLSVDMPTVKTARKTKKEKRSEELSARPPSPIPPIVQSFDPPRQRPATAWPSAPNRPQLHIFMPPLQSEDCDSCTSDATCCTH